MKLSIIIAALDDHDELAQTLASIRHMEGFSRSDVEIIVVDDGSKAPFAASKAGAWSSSLADKVIRNQRRIGVGSARHVGAEASTGDMLFFCDSHCRFDPPWLVRASRHLKSPNTLFCGQCVPLEGEQLMLDRPYYGATWNMCGADRNVKSVPTQKQMMFPRRSRASLQIFEVVWAPPKHEEVYEISGVMGACYFIPREFYFHIRPLQFLRSWGADEQALSLKTWLSGGDIKLLRNVFVGHRFRQKGTRSIELSDPLYNKLFLLHTCLSPEECQRFCNKLNKADPLYRVALKRLQADWHLVETERAHNQRIFTRTFTQFCEHFGFQMP